MTNHYLSKWTEGDYWIDKNNKKSEWFDFLAKMPLKNINLGIIRSFECREWPPNRTEFLNLSKPKPEDMSAPSMDMAFLEACNGGTEIFKPMSTKNGEVYQNTTAGHKWSHPAIFHARNAVQGFSFIENDKSKRKQFDDMYLETIQRMFSGENLEAPETLYLTSHPSGTVPYKNPDTARNAIDAMKKMNFSPIKNKTTNN